MHFCCVKYWAPIIFFTGEQGGDCKGSGEEEEGDGEEQGEEQEHGHDCPVYSYFVMRMDVTANLTKREWVLVL